METIFCSFCKKFKECKKNKTMLETGIGNCKRYESNENEMLLKRIDTKERELKKLKDNIKWLKKEIWKQKENDLGYLKLDCKDLIKTIDKYYKTKTKLYELYRKQNEIGRATHKAIEKHLGIRG